MLSQKIALMILLSFLSAAGAGYVALHKKSPVAELLYIPDGSHMEIISQLDRQNSPIGTINGWFFVFSKKPTPGWVRIKGRMSPAQLWSALLNLPREKTRKVVFYSDETIEEFADSFARQARLKKKEILDYYYMLSPFLEGGIVAGFYDLPYDIDAKTAISFMVGRSEDIFEDLFERLHEDEYSPESFKRFLIIASIIQKETWKEEEMGLISSVIYNRLKKNMKLQMDATLRYGRYSHKAVTPSRIRRDRSRYNTYRYRGLPPEPLCSVTREALEAALKPTDTKYLYFIRNIYGTHDFSPDYAGHLANISRYKYELAKLRRYRKLLRSGKKLNR